MSARPSKAAIDRELRARIVAERPKGVVLELFGLREEHDHVRGCAIRAGSHAFACTCHAIVATDLAASRNRKYTGHTGDVELPESTAAGLKQTGRTLESRLERICDRVESEVHSFPDDDNARVLWLARGEISQANAAIARGLRLSALAKLATAAFYMDSFEAGERERVLDAAMRGRKRASQ